MKSLSLLRLFVGLAAVSLGTVVLQAQDPGLKARIEQRVASVNVLKNKGVAGENNRGYLEARGNASGADQQIISAENADRRAVYAAIAAKTKANPDQVGQKRAAQIASIAAKGHWVQDANGAWKQK